MNKSEHPQPLIESLRHQLAQLQNQVTQLPSTPDEAEQLGRAFEDLRVTVGTLEEAVQLPDHQLLQSEIDASNHRLAHVLESMPDAFCTVDQTWRLMFINSQAEQLLQKTRDQLLGQHLWDVYSDAIGSSFYQTYHQAMSERVALRVEDFYPTLSIWLEVNVYPMDDGLAFYIRDVSDRKHLEEELRRDQQLLQAVVDAAPIEIFLKDLQGRYLMLNGCGCHALGLSQEQALGKTDYEILPLDIAEQFQASDRSALEANCPVTTEKTLHRSGRTTTQLTTKFPVYDAAGNLQALGGVCFDITSRKRMEEALRRSEECFSKAFRANPSATAITSINEGRYTDVNDSWLRLLGFTREEVVGKTSLELGVWARPDQRDQILQRLLQQQSIHNQEVRFRTKSGNVRDGITSLELVDLNGELCVLSQLYDVTVHKQAEGQLQHRLAFEALLTSISTHFINLKSSEIDQGIRQALQQIGTFSQVDRVCVFLISERRFFKGYEWCAAAIPSLDYPAQGLPLDEVSLTIEQLQQVIHVPSVADLPEPRKSLAQAFGVKSHVTVPIAYEGQLIGSLAFNSIQTTKTWSAEDILLLRALADIFASALMRKRADEALRESEERFRQLTENVDAVFWVFSLEEQQTLYISPAYEKIWGRSLQSLYEGNTASWLDSIYPEDRTLVLDYLERYNQGEQVEQIYRINKPDGSVRWIRDRAFPVHDPQGTRYRMAGLAEDITDRVEAEQALRESEERFRQVVENIDTVFWIRTAQAQKILYISPAYERIWGRLRQSLYENDQDWLNSIHPDDQLQITSLVERQYWVEPSETVYRLIRPDGTVRWIHERLFPVYDAQGNYYRTVGFADDITARKQTEDALRESQAKLSAILGSAIAVIVRFRAFRDYTWEHEFYSSGSETIYGYTPEELKNDAYLWLSRLHPEDAERVRQQIFEAIFAEQPIRLEYRFHHKDGSMRWISYTSISQRDEARDCWIVTVVDTDITALKQVERQLQASLQEKDALLKEVHHRVKNNLQVVSSLLDLQSQRIQDRFSLELFRESQSRIQSMALIHEKLYQSNTVPRIDFADYIRSLTTHLVQTYTVNPETVTIQINVEAVALSIDASIPCGLILNELVSNALKHAFEGCTNARIWVELKQQPSAALEPQFELVVGNNGAKLPQVPDFAKAQSLGFQLVNALVEQLNGQIEVDQTQGIEFRVRFSDLEPSTSS